jgi:proteasome lid subunit RPN8/RPN11
MNTKLKSSIIEMAKASSEEICGFMYATQNEVKLYPCRNIATTPIEDFSISQDDYLECIKLGTVMAVYHSHPTGPASFSEADLHYADEAVLPFYLYDVASGEWSEYLPPDYHVKLEGRPFYWGFDDCYGATRHYYRETLGLHLHDYDRDDTFGPTRSLAIMDHFGDERFILLPPTATIQPHDIMLFDISPRCPQHMSIFLGNQRMFHHPLNMLSKIELLSGGYIERLSHILRHKTMVVSV